ncbi:MAG: hypothetical protein ABIJ96_11165 [Elusimicrobiota bacterium]
MPSKLIALLESALAYRAIQGLLFLPTLTMVVLQTFAAAGEIRGAGMGGGAFPVAALGRAAWVVVCIAPIKEIYEANFVRRNAPRILPMLPAFVCLIMAVAVFF